MTDLVENFKSLPLFTRYWLGLTAALSLLARFAILDPMYLILTFDTVFYKFQIWRLATCVFFYPINSNTGIHFLFNCYFLYSYSVRLETEQYQGKPADYAFLLLFGWVLNVAAAFIFDIYFIMDSAVMIVLYIWCQLNKEVVVRFWFGTRFQAMYLPWVLFLFNLIINGRGMLDLLGIMIGHTFFFLKYQYPMEFNGPDWLTTPSFLYKYFPNERIVTGFGATPIRREPDPQERRAGHNWGSGNVLGGH